MMNIKVIQFFEYWLTKFYCFALQLSKNFYIFFIDQLRVKAVDIFFKIFLQPLIFLSVSLVLEKDIFNRVWDYCMGKVRWWVIMIINGGCNRMTWRLLVSKRSQIPLWWSFRCFVNMLSFFMKRRWRLSEFNLGEATGGWFFRKSWVYNKKLVNFSAHL